MIATTDWRRSRRAAPPPRGHGLFLWKLTFLLLAPRLFSHLLRATLLHSEVDNEGRVSLVPDHPQRMRLSAVQEG